MYGRNDLKTNGSEIEAVVVAVGGFFLLCLVDPSCISVKDRGGKKNRPLSAGFEQRNHPRTVE